MKHYFMAFIAVSIIFMTSCSGNDSPSNPADAKLANLESTFVPESDTDTDTDEEVWTEPLPTPAQASRDYYFYDESVKYEIARYFGKKAEELKLQDLKILEDLTFFEFWEGGLLSLKDLPEILPKLRYVNLGTYNPSVFSEDDLTILQEMELLRGLSLYTDGLPSLQFARYLEYVNIIYSEEGYLSDQNNLDEASVLGNEFVRDSLVGNIKEYLRVTDADIVYELFCTDFDNNVNEYDECYETRLFISEQDGDAFRLIECLEVPGRIANASGGLLLADVDYDGQKDILIKRGHFGNQGLVTYTCFLKRGDEYVLNESFSEIANPSLDQENRMVLSAWRNWSASHSWAMYVFSDGLFSETDRLTEEPESDNTENWKYTVEKYVGGKVTASEVYFTREYTEEEILDLFFAEEGYWGLKGDKWNTLNNLGSYSGYGIYDGTAVDAQVSEIIGDSGK